MPRHSASLCVRVEGVEVTAGVAVWASVEVEVVRLVEGPSARHKEAASGEDTEETRPVGSLPTYQHTG